LPGWRRKRLALAGPVDHRVGLRIFRAILPVCLSGIAVHAFAAADTDRAADDLAARTIVVANSTDADSVHLAHFYAARRHIPESNIVAQPMPAEETITWPVFVAQVWEPLQDALVARGWLEGVIGQSRDAIGRRESVFSSHRIAYLVLCRGTPLRIEHDAALAPENLTRRYPAPLRTNAGAVDSELSLVASGNYEVNSLLPNPLFRGQGGGWPSAALVVKVARLDGPTVADARGLVTSALEAERTGIAGRTYVDLRAENPEGDGWLNTTAHELADLGFEGDVERTARLFDADDRFDAPVFYFGWYAANCTGPFMRDGFRFPPGAVALHIHSFSAETLRSTGRGWCGPFVARGVTATMGNVFEPYLDFTHRPDLFVAALARGASLGDAAYEALPVLSWQAILVGDPLYRPFPIAGGAHSASELPPGLQPYDWIRRARNLARGDKPAEADALLAEQFKHLRHAALATARARIDFEHERGPAGLAALESIAAGSDFSPAEWPALGEAAHELEARGDTRALLALYGRWTRAPAPDAERRASLFAAAIKAAHAAGDGIAAREFERLRDNPASPEP
jgi:uncharacterized protein (TIGR03790 family)